MRVAFSLVLVRPHDGYCARTPGDDEAESRASRSTSTQAASSGLQMAVEMRQMTRNRQEEDH